MQTVTLTLPKLHPAQAQVKLGHKRFNVVNCGRRWGKTTQGQDILTETLLQGKPAAWFSPTYKMLSDVWRGMTSTLYPITRRTNTQEHQLELVTGGVLDMWSLDDPNAGRGRKYAEVVIDEAAMVRNLELAWQAAIRPTLTDYSGGAWFFSTPKGLNYFHALYRRGQDAKQGEWASWQMPTASNPYIKGSEIEAARGDLPERIFNQEYLAQFLADGSYFYNLDAVCTVPRPELPADHKGHSFVMGVDWGKSVDFTVLTVICRECSRVVDWERFNKIDYTFQRARLRALFDKWHVSKILPERNSIGEPNIEMLVRESLPIINGADGRRGFNTTASSKAVLMEALALALGQAKLHVPAAYRDELASFEIETRDIGPARYGAPEGQHDDMVISLALAWQAAKSGLQIW